MFERTNHSRIRSFVRFSLLLLNFPQPTSSNHHDLKRFYVNTKYCSQAKNNKFRTFSVSLSFFQIGFQQKLQIPTEFVSSFKFQRFKPLTVVEFSDGSTNRERRENDSTKIRIKSVIASKGHTFMYFGIYNCGCLCVHVSIRKSVRFFVRYDENVERREGRK